MIIDQSKGFLVITNHRWTGLPRGCFESACVALLYIPDSVGGMRRTALVSAWRDADEISTPMNPGSVKRRRMKHKLVLNRCSAHGDVARPKISLVSQVSPLLSSHKPVSSSLISPTTPISLFSPVTSKSERIHFFKRKSFKLKSILKKSRSLPHVKEGRSVIPLFLVIQVIYVFSFPFHTWIWPPICGFFTQQSREYRYVF